MALSEYTLDKEFDVLATWFRVDETAEEGVKGKLHFSNEAIILDLYATFSASLIDEAEELDSIYGLSTSGEILLLKHCLPVSEEASSLGFAVESYSIDTFYLLDLKDEMPINTEILEVENIQFSLNHLHSWMSTNAFDPSIDLNHSKRQYYSVPSQKIIVSTGVTHHRKRKKRAVILEETYFMEIAEESMKASSFDSLFKDAALVKKLIEFLSSSPLEYTYVEFGFVQGKGRYFFKQAERQLTHLPQNTLTLNQIKKEFSLMLDHWFIKADPFDLIIDTYLNDLYLDYYIETKFVNSIRNLEMYYRSFVRDPRSLEKRRESLQADQQLLLEFVEEEVSEKYKQHFIRNILYVGEESLRVKLNELISNLPEPLFTECIKQTDKSPSKSRSSFINKLMETRNYYTHGDEAEKYPDRLTDPKDFLSYNEKLKLFQRYYIYKELGLTEELILSILSPEACQLK